MASGWGKVAEASGRIGEALMQLASMSESRRYRAAMLDRGTRADELAIARIEKDHEMLAANRVQQEANWIKEGWTGTPGTQVWTPGQYGSQEQAPVDPLVGPTDLGGGLFDRQPAEMNPLAQAAMGAEPGATYPGPSPIAMGGDPSQFGAELMQTPQFGGDVVPGGFEQASYDPRMSTEYQEEVARNELLPPPTYGVSGGTPSVTGLGTEAAATGFASRNQPGATFGIGAGGEVTATGVDRADLPGILDQFYPVFDPSGPWSPARQASFALVDSMSENVVTPDTREWLESLDDESVANFVDNAEAERRASLAPGESDRRAAATVDRVLVGYQEIEQQLSEIGGAPAGAAFPANAATRKLTSEETERWRAATIAVVGGTLRWTSGAAIGKDEIKNLSEALVPQPFENPGTAFFKMQALQAQIGAMVRSASLATGRDYGERWENVGIDRLRPTVNEDTRIAQLLAEVVPGQPDGWAGPGTGGWTDNQIEWFLTMEGYK